MSNLGADFDRAVLNAAGINPDMVQAGTLSIDIVPTTGPATIRYTMVGTLDSAALRSIVADAATPGDG